MRQNYAASIPFENTRRRHFPRRVGFGLQAGAQRPHPFIGRADPDLLIGCGAYLRPVWRVVRPQRLDAHGHLSHRLPGLHGVFVRPVVSLAEDERLRERVASHRPFQLTLDQLARVGVAGGLRGHGQRRRLRQEHVQVPAERGVYGSFLMLLGFLTAANWTAKIADEIGMNMRIE